MSMSRLLCDVGCLLDVEDVQREVVCGEGQRPVRVAFAPVGEQVSRQSRDEASGPQQVAADMRIQEQDGEPVRSGEDAGRAGAGSAAARAS